MLTTTDESPGPATGSRLKGLLSDQSPPEPLMRGHPVGHTDRGWLPGRGGRPW